MRDSDDTFVNRLLVEEAAGVHLVPAQHGAPG